MRLKLAVTLLLVSIASQVFAWSDAGHKITAAIAFGRLTKPQQKKIVGMIKSHPRFADDFEDKMPDDLDDDSMNEWIFVQAAVWPDMVRNGPAKPKYHHAPWHYINLPYYLNAADEGVLEPTIKVNLNRNPPANPADKLNPDKNMNVIQTIRYARSVLSDPDEMDAELKAVMLCWLLHTVGDVHQPLHSTALYSQGLFPGGDRGGNSIKTEQHGELHAVWDTFPGGKVQLNTVRKRVSDILDTAGMDQLGKKAAADLNEETWLNESNILAVTVAYDPDVIVFLRGLEPDHPDIESLPSLNLSDEYLRAGGSIARKRLVQGGYRLGEILKSIAN